MTRIRLTTPWTEYTKMASMTFEQYLTAVRWSSEFINTAKRHYDKVTKYAVGMPYGLGIDLLAEQELGLPYFTEWELTEEKR